MLLILRVPKTFLVFFIIFHYMLLFVLLLLPCTTFAEYRLGGCIGFGGTGVTTVSSVDGSDMEVSRSDGPIMLNLAAEVLTSDTSSISLNHIRGIAITPFSSGVTFTGFTWRWYFMGQAPSMVPSQEDRSTLMITKKVFFWGLSTGVANGSVSRTKDLVSSVDASGVYFGFNGGYDYQTDPGKIIRVEVLSHTSPKSSGFVQSSLSAFAIQIGMFFIY